MWNILSNLHKDHQLGNVIRSVVKHRSEHLVPLLEIDRKNRQLTINASNFSVEIDRSFLNQPTVLSTVSYRIVFFVIILCTVLMKIFRENFQVSLSAYYNTISLPLTLLKYEFLHKEL